MIRDVLIRQKREFEQRLKDRYVERDCPPSALRDSDLVKVVIGPRRAGKSFFAVRQIGHVQGTGYVNFDDEHLDGLTDFDGLLSGVDDLYGRPTHLLLDEIQNVPRWELLVNRLQREGRRLVVTGSNSHLLSSELATHLTGRHQQILLFPFSYREVRRMMGTELTQAEQKSLLNRYVRDGGFPEPWVKDVDRTDYLRTLVNSVLYKDIVKRFHIRAVQGLDDLAHYLFSNVAKEFSYQNLTRTTRCRSVHTAEKYVRHLQEAFLFFTVKRFSFKVREQAASNKKVYCLDTGLAVALGFRPGADEGRLMENLVAIELHKSELMGNAEVFFWRGDQGEEVDFVIRQDKKVAALLQVCRDISDARTLSREVRALVRAGHQLKCRDLLILTEDVEKVEQAEWFGLKGRIRYVPLWKWLSDRAGSAT